MYLSKIFSPILPKPNFGFIRAADVQEKDNTSEYRTTENAKHIETTFDTMVNCKYFDLRYSKLINEATKAKAKGRLDDAIKIYSGIYTNNNHELRAITGLADCYSRKGDYKEAYKYINEAKGIMPNLDNVDRIERDIYFSKKADSNDLLGNFAKSSFRDNNLSQAKDIIEKTSSTLKVALTGVPVRFGKINPEALAISDGFAITLNETELATAAPQVLAAVIAHEAVHSGDRDRDSSRDDTDSISEETDAFEEGAKVWITNRGGLSELGEDNAASKFLKGREVLKGYIRELYSDNHASTQEYSPGHYEEVKKHEPGAVTCKTANGFEAINKV